MTFRQSLKAPSTKPRDAGQFMEMLGPSYRAYIFRHHFAHMILVASTERPAMPISTPFLGALKAEKYVQRDERAIHRNRPRFKDTAQTSRKHDSKKKVAAVSGAASKAKRSAIQPHFLENVPRRGVRPLRRRPLRLAPQCSRRSETHPLRRLRAKSSLFSPSKGKPGRGSEQSTETTAVHVTRSSCIDSAFIFQSPQTPLPRLRPHLHLLLRLRTLTVLEFGGGRGSSRWF